MSSINAIQDRIETQLLRNNWFSDALASVPRPVPIITADDGDIATEVERTVAESGGIAVVVLIPFGKNLQPEHGVSIARLTVEISVIEAVIINRSSSGLNKKAYDAIRKIVAPWKADGTGGLQFWKPGPPFSRLEFQEFDEGAVSSQSDDKTLLVYRALFETTETIT